MQTPDIPCTNRADQPDLLAHDSFYRALEARDTRFDGVFFTGVKTTRIYCRPVCAARTPRASSCEFFKSAAAAEAAGFRPCLRCRPELAPYAIQQNLAYAVWQRIAAGALNDTGDGSGIEQLATTVGLSSRQLRRVLMQHFGVSPIELAQTQRLLFAKKLLHETSLPMTDVAYAAGFGSVRRFNALFATRYGIAPTTIRRTLVPAGIAGSDALTLRLAYRPPLAWDTMLRYLAARAVPGIEAVDNHCYVRSVQWQGLAGPCGWLRVSHLPRNNLLLLEVAPGLAGVLMPLLAQVRCQFDLDANPTLIAEHLQQDPLLAPHSLITPGLRVPGSFDVFELALRAVLGQQVSVAGATTLSGRLVAQFGAPARTPFSQITHHTPQAQTLAHASIESIAHIGLPRSRAETITALARFATEGHLTMAPGGTLEQAVSALRSVRGIGEWTAQYIALRALRFPNAFPAGDLGLQQAASAGAPGMQRLTEKQLLTRSKYWAPWRGYAAMLLWHSLNPAP